MDGSTIVGVIVALLIVLASVFFAFFRGSSEKRDKVVILGPSGSGKTTIWCQLVYGKRPPFDTTVSMKSSEGEAQEFKTDGQAAFKLVDLPGHPRVRDGALAPLTKKAKGLVFVLDSARFTKEYVTDVAEYFYQVLSTAELTNCPVLVLCNKQDQIFKKTSAENCRVKLQSEFNLVRKTRSGTLDSTDDTATVTNIVLGTEGTDFEFSQLDTTVEFVEFSAKDAKTPSDVCDLTVVTDWLKKYAL
eukprot:m.258905 g.258905  ORF g.258905 m.258905 type:complete len:245 (+) comp37246_c0_seq1:99-833(+)